MRGRGPWWGAPTAPLIIINKFECFIQYLESLSYFDHDLRQVFAFNAPFCSIEYKHVSTGVFDNPVEVCIVQLNQRLLRKVLCMIDAKLFLY